MFTHQIHDLPSNLDAVVISHSHYDHLDLNTVVMLNARFGNEIRWFVPLGLGEFTIGQQSFTNNLFTF